MTTYGKNKNAKKKNKFLEKIQKQIKRRKYNNNGKLKRKSKKQKHECRRIYKTGRRKDLK